MQRIGRLNWILEFSEPGQSVTLIYVNGDDRIDGGSGSTVSGNTVRGNTGYGLRFSGTDAAYSENVISNNRAGTVGGTAVEFGQNVCEGNETCP